jgi:hypothetical protein
MNIQVTNPYNHQPLTLRNFGTPGRTRTYDLLLRRQVFCKRKYHAINVGNLRFKAWARFRPEAANTAVRHEASCHHLARSRRVSVVLLQNIFVSFSYFPPQANQLVHSFDLLNKNALNASRISSFFGLPQRASAASELAREGLCICVIVASLAQ